VSEEKLPIHGLADRHRGLTQPIGETYTEAARVCLDRHHTSPVDFKIDDTGLERDATAEWEGTDELTRNAWANDTDATEAGAYACALAALELARGMVAVRRAETKTGADYYVALPGGGEEDLEDCIRFEVSGVDTGLISRLRQRLQAKLDQTAAGVSNLPAVAGIVGFKAKLILLKSLGDDQ
jgi:hypothetical protein